MIYKDTRIKMWMSKNKKFNLFLIIVAVTQYLLMIYYEWHYYNNILNSDVAADLLLADTMSKKGNWILCKEWFYTTELHLLHTQLVETWLFRVTNNYKLVFVLTFAIMTFGVCFIGYILVKKITGNISAGLLTTLLLLVPSGEFYHISFKVQSFSPYVLFVYLFVYLLLEWREYRESKKEVILNVILACFAFIMGSCGIRFFSLVFLPLLACEIWEFIKVNLTRETLTIDKQKVRLSGSLIFFAFIGYVFYRFVLEKQYGPVGTSNAVLVGGRDVMENLMYTPIGLLEIFGGFLFAGEYIIDIEGICQIIILVMVFLMYIIFGYSFFWKNLDENFIYIRRFLIFSFLINVFLIAFTALGKSWGRLLEIHYLAVGICLFLPMVVIIFYKARINCLFKNGIFILICGYVVVCNWAVFRAEPACKPEYVGELNSHDYSFGWSTDYWKANRTSALLDGKVEIATIQPDGQTGKMEVYCWGTKRSYREKKPEFVIFKLDDDIDKIAGECGIECINVYADEEVIICEVKR